MTRYAAMTSALRRRLASTLASMPALADPQRHGITATKTRAIIGTCDEIERRDMTLRLLVSLSLAIRGVTSRVPRHVVFPRSARRVAFVL